MQYFHILVGAENLNPNQVFRALCKYGYNGIFAKVVAERLDETLKKEEAELYP